MDRQDQFEGESWFIDDCAKASASLLEAIAAIDAPFPDDTEVLPDVLPPPSPRISAPDSAPVESPSASSSSDNTSWMQGNFTPLQVAVATPTMTFSDSRSVDSIFSWGAHTPGNLPHNGHLPLLGRMLGSNQQYLPWGGELPPPHLPWAFTRAPPYAAWDGPLAVYGKRPEKQPLREAANKRTRRSPSFAAAISSSKPGPSSRPTLTDVLG